MGLRDLYGGNLGGCYIRWDDNQSQRQSDRYADHNSSLMGRGSENYYGMNWKCGNLMSQDEGSWPKN